MPPTPKDLYDMPEDKLVAHMSAGLAETNARLKQLDEGWRAEIKRMGDFPDVDEVAGDDKKMNIQMSEIEKEFDEKLNKLILEAASEGHDVDDIEE